MNMPGPTVASNTLTISRERGKGIKWRQDNFGCRKRVPGLVPPPLGPVLGDMNVLIKDYEVWSFHITSTRH